MRLTPGPRRVSQSSSLGLLGLEFPDTLELPVHESFLIPDGSEALLGNNMIGPLQEIGGLLFQSGKDGFWQQFIVFGVSQTANDEWSC